MLVHQYSGMENGNDSSMPLSPTAGGRPYDESVCTQGRSVDPGRRDDDHMHRASALLAQKKLNMPLILFNKPFQVMCQFSPHPSRQTLADYITVPDIYPAGRLDADSEGLVLLTDDGRLQHAISHPKQKQSKIYLAQVEGIPDTATLQRLRQPLALGDFVTQPCKASLIQEPAWLWERTPPIRERSNVPTSWLAITLSEGKNRQVRRMTAAVGLPTLRLVRIAIGPFSLESHPLLPGEWVEVDPGLLRS